MSLYENLTVEMLDMLNNLDMLDKLDRLSAAPYFKVRRPVLLGCAAARPSRAPPRALECAAPYFRVRRLVLLGCAAARPSRTEASSFIRVHRQVLWGAPPRTFRVH